MKDEYKKKKITPVGKGSKNLSSLISKQLSYLNKNAGEAAEYEVDKSKHGKKVLNTSPERTQHHKPSVSKQKSPSPTNKAATSHGAMFTEMRKSAYKRRPL